MFPLDLITPYCMEDNIAHLSRGIVEKKVTTMQFVPPNSPYMLVFAASIISVALVLEEPN